MSSMAPTRTRVAIVGGGPAGLMLSHLLYVAGIESVVVDNRTVEQIETTHRAGILERDSVRLLVDSGVSDRVLTDGHEHEGISLRFGGVSHRIDFQKLAGASCWLYPQTEVFIDLHRARTRDGGELRYGITDTEVVDPKEELLGPEDLLQRVTRQVEVAREPAQVGRGARPAVAALRDG